MQRLVHQSTTFSTTGSPNATGQRLAWASIVLWVLMAGIIAGCAKCDSGSWVCMSLKLLAVAHVFYPWGQGYIRIYQIYEQMSFASECREQAREDTMLCIFHMFHPFFKQICLSSMFQLTRLSRVFGLRVEATCPPTEGNTPGDLKPGERVGAPPM